MQEYLPFLWLAVIVFMIVAEAATNGLVAIWFVFGALASFVLSLFLKNFYVELAVFAVISLLGFIFLRRVLKKALSDSSRRFHKTSDT